VKCGVFFLVLAAIFVASVIFTAQAQDAGENAVYQAQRLMVSQKYPAATALAKAALKNDPGDIDAVFTLAIIEQTRILDYESYAVDGRRFLVFADSLLKILEAEQPRFAGVDSLRCLFYRAGILGGIGVVHVKLGSWLDGARNGLASQNLYKQIRRIDPGHLGADLGLGVFDYYFGTSLRLIPFVANTNVERGLAAIERSLNVPFPFDHGAKSTYCWILIDRNEFQKADSLALSALAETPGSTIFLRIRALAALRLKNYKIALELGKELAEASESRTPVNWSDLMMSYYIITDSYENLGRRAEAITAAEKALEMPVPDALRKTPHIRDHIRFLTRTRAGR
jgi:tetratricopeptide (TPR) repeat protein